MHGLIYYIDGAPHTVDLERVSAKATLIDLSARVQLTQTYHNESSTTLSCSYMFPVPARSAVCGFAMVKQDGTRVVGVVQEKEEARVTYDEAVKEGKLASLTEQASPDSFVCSVGNVLPKETVKIELTYVTELTEGDTSDSIRFHVPAIVGQRYGQQPLFGGAHIPSSTKTALEFSANIEAASAITKVSSPSHPVSLELGPDRSLAHTKDLPSANYARVTFSTSTTLEKDIVLTIHASGLDQPRCVAELHPSAKSAAVSLTLVPRFKLPEVEGQEYIFLVDRSGSMGAWSAGEGRIGMARKALVVLLRSLPSTSTSFNIASFGSSVQSLWPSSQPYNQSTLDTATKHVDSLEANLGGTDTRKALDFVFQSRTKSKQTSVFVLTDGDAWDLDGVISSVKSAVASGTLDKPVRCFVLGIGNDASTAMCESIARHGGGIAQYVVDGESFTGKTARLLRAARTPRIVNARLDFGLKDEDHAEEDFELVEAAAPASEARQDKDKAPINLFDSCVDPLADTDSTASTAPPAPPVKLPPPSRIQQAPRDLSPLYPSSRLHAYAILKSAKDLPETIFLRGELASGQKLELAVPVVRSQIVSSSDSHLPPPIHTIAARKLIQDLEDGKHDLGVKDDLDLTKRTVEAAVVRLGKTYWLASSQTSFVAVDESEKDKPRRATQYQVIYDSPPYGGAVAFGGAAPAGPHMRRSRMAAPMSTFAAIPPPPPAPVAAAPALFGAPPAQAQPRFGRMMKAVKRAVPFGSSAPPPTDAMQTMSLAQAATAAPVLDSGLPPPPPAGGLFNRYAHSPEQPEPAAAPTDPLDAIARHQSFDGSFDPAVLSLCPPSAALDELLKKLPAALQEKEGKEKLVATAAVLAYWRREMRDREEEWEGMAEKAMAFLRSEAGDEAEGLVALLA